jgi:hypothetical protein
MTLSRRDIIIEGLLVLCIVYLLFFHKPNPPADNQAAIKAYDEYINDLRSQVVTLRAEKDSAIAARFHVEQGLQDKQQVIKKKYDKIPVTVHDLSKDELRRELSNY